MAWVQVGGQDPLKWISKYGNRIVAAHIKDIAPKGECADEDGWADVGTGIMNWPEIMTDLRAARTKYYVMERPATTCGKAHTANGAAENI